MSDVNYLCTSFSLTHWLKVLKRKSGIKFLEAQGFTNLDEGEYLRTVLRDGTVGEYLHMSKSVLYKTTTSKLREITPYLNAKTVKTSFLDPTIITKLCLLKQSELLTCTENGLSSVKEVEITFPLQNDLHVLSKDDKENGYPQHYFPGADKTEVIIFICHLVNVSEVTVC